MTSQQFILSLLAGGLSAAIFTAAFNVWWNGRRQEIAERWESRKYEANLKLQLLFKLTEIYYANINELYFVILEVGSLHASFAVIEQEMSRNLQSQNPALPVGQVQTLLNPALAPTKQLLSQIEMNRWLQYNNSVKNLRSSAGAALSVAEYALTTKDIYARLATLINQLSENLNPAGVEGAQRRLQEMTAREQEFKYILRQIRDEARSELGHK